MKQNTIFIIGAAGAAYLLLSAKKKEGEGSGGSPAVYQIPIIPNIFSTPDLYATPSTAPPQQQPQQQPLIQSLLTNFVSPDSYSANTYAGNTNPINPIAASGTAVYNPFASILSIPIAGTAVPSNPYGSGNAILYNPAAATEKKSTTVINPIATSLNEMYNPIYQTSSKKASSSTSSSSNSSNTVYSNPGSNRAPSYGGGWM